MPETDPLSVSLLDKKHAVTMPDFSAREELVVAYGEAQSRKGVALLRVYAAALGLCTRLGAQSGANYAKSRFDVLAYGGEVYSWLRAQGLTATQIAQAAVPVVVAVTEATFPRESEVTSAAGNSEGGAGI